MSSVVSKIWSEIIHVLKIENVQLSARPVKFDITSLIPDKFWQLEARFKFPTKELQNISLDMKLSHACCPFFSEV